MKKYMDKKFEELYQKLKCENDFSFTKIQSLDELSNLESKLDNLTYNGKMVSFYNYYFIFISFTRLIFLR